MLAHVQNPCSRLGLSEGLINDLRTTRGPGSELGVVNGGIVDADYGSGLSCRDPDNIALEFFAPAI
jgi:hypothetical protein